jgi:hypothetical protein
LGFEGVKLLYLSCHEVLAHDEIALFRELGIDVFCPDAISNANANDGATLYRGQLRPQPYGTTICADDVAAFEECHRGDGRSPILLSPAFVDRFDVVVVMHEPEVIIRNWEALRRRTVIWRTIGQSTPAIELTMQSYRNDGLRIVRYSPAERVLPNYAGENALIRFYKDASEWQGWTGERPVIVCFSQSMPRRAEACHYDVFEQVTSGLPCELYGPGNEAAGVVWQGCLPYDQLRAVLRTSRACFHTGTFPASYTLGFIEAWLTGIPVVAIGSSIFGRPEPMLSGLYELPQLIDHEVNGFVSDDIDELRSCLKCLLAHRDFAGKVSQAGCATAKTLFDKPVAREQWGHFFAGL